MSRATGGRRRHPTPAPVPGWPRGLGARVAAGCALAALAVAVGLALLHGQEHYRALADAGEDLGTPEQLIADGSTAYTAGVGWVMALLFGLSTRRLARGAPEEPLGLGREETSASGIRAAMRREWRLVRRLLVVVGLLAVAEAGRAVVYAGAAMAGSAVAADALLGAGVEAVGFAAAAAILAVWSWLFRGQLETLGAI